MEVLQYNDLDVGRARAALDRTVEALRAGDFRAADVKKLKGTPYYRAKLSDADRLLFRFGSYRGTTFLLLLEIIAGHAYDKSRFLNGARVDETKLQPLPGAGDVPAVDVQPLPFVNAKTPHFHVLDKILSFDDRQLDAFGLRTPLILIGSAGSGKTVLTLEKLKSLHGDGLYVTLSAYLAENARNLYRSFGYENERQNVDFLSFQEYVETLHVPRGRPLAFGEFEKWFARHCHGTGVKDPHMLFEEFNGVLTGMPVSEACLTRDAYVGLGVRQSIFPAEQRETVYDLFLRYVDWLRESDRYNPNLVAFEYLPRCVPRYDFVVVDEVQDITNVQLQLILKSLRSPENFVLCGDSNQIVHPNFFSWAKVKTMFYEQRVDGRGEIMRVLNSNYRNSPQVTELANRLLLIKNARFGSIDRESNYLVQAVSDRAGTVELMRDNDKIRRELDSKTARSTKFAVLVMRGSDKEDAKRHFKTPLIFSIQEAKGLEYENIILLDFVSGNAREFDEIVSGVTPGDIDGELRYARARDKSDKSLEALKFFTNALYVALTRAVRNVYVIEANPEHRLWRLLDLRAAREEVKVKAAASSDDDWKAEARKLELQGKTEQADAIRRTILATQEVPWRVLTPAALDDLKREALDPSNYNRQAKLLLFEYALTYNVPTLLSALARHGFKRAERPYDELKRVEQKYSRGYLDPSFREVKRQIDLYGVDFRDPLNQTPLMVAAKLGLSELVKNLLKDGAHPDATDSWGRTSLHIALRQGYFSPDYAASRLGEIYPLLAPSSIKVKVEGRMIKIDRTAMEFFVLHSMIALFQDMARVKARWEIPSFETADFVYSLEHFSEHVIPERRKRRSYLSSILSKNEVDRQDHYNRKLFLRVRRGHYILNPRLELEVHGEWVNVYDVIGIGEMEQEDPEASVEAGRLSALIQHIRAIQRGEEAPPPDPVGAAPNFFACDDDEPWEEEQAEFEPF